MTLLDQLAAALAEGKIMIVSQERADANIVLIVSFPNTDTNLLPETLRMGETPGNWQSKSATISTKPGAWYELAVNVIGTKSTNVVVKADGATLGKKGGVNTLTVAFQAKAETTKLTIGATNGTGLVKWSEGTLRLIKDAPVEPKPAPEPVIEVVQPLPEPAPPTPVEPKPDPAPVPPEPAPPPAPLPEVVAPVVVTPPSTAKTLVGVNCAMGEFKGSARPGTKGKDYAYPSDTYLGWIVGQGFKVVRVPFLLERVLQGPPLSARDDMKDLVRIAKYLTGKGVVTWLDMHNYGRINGAAIDANSAPIYADAWGLIADQMKGQNVWFGLMNEPHDQDGDAFHDAQLLAIAKIRETGHGGKVLATTVSWAGAHSFLGSNSERFLKKPVLDYNWSLELHQYLDSDSSGTHETTVSGKGAKVLQPLTDWARRYKIECVLGEYGTPKDVASLAELGALVGHMHDNADVWIAHTYWAAGSWWGSSYSRAIGDNKSNEQLGVLKKFMS